MLIVTIFFNNKFLYTDFLKGIWCLNGLITRIAVESFTMSKNTYIYRVNST